MDIALSLDRHVIMWQDVATNSLSSTNGDFKGGAGPLLQTKPGICVYIIRLPACTRLVHVPISKSY